MVHHLRRTARKKVPSILNGKGSSCLTLLETPAWTVDRHNTFEVIPSAGIQASQRESFGRRSRNKKTTAAMKKPHPIKKGIFILAPSVPRAKEPRKWNSIEIRCPTATAWPNPILEKGCPRSVGGIWSAVALCLELGIDFELEPLDCEPFYHGYGENCSDAKLTIGVWQLPLVDLNGNKMDIPFYNTKGSGILLLGNELLSKSDILNTQNRMRTPPGTVKGLASEVHLLLYTTKDAEVRAHLHVIPCRVPNFRDYFSSFRSLYGSDRTQHPSRKESPRFMGKSAMAFARKLHMYSHLPLRDMKLLCKRGRILQPVLKQALRRVIEKCSSCKSTGRPLKWKYH